MRSTNPKDVAYMFRDYARRIHAKASPTDPHFVRISVACGKVGFRFSRLPFHPRLSFGQIEQWCEHHYPSFVRVVSGGVTGGLRARLNSSDPRSHVFLHEKG